MYPSQMIKELPFGTEIRDMDDLINNKENLAVMKVISVSKAT